MTTLDKVTGNLECLAKKTEGIEVGKEYKIKDFPGIKDNITAIINNFTADIAKKPHQNVVEILNLQIKDYSMLLKGDETFIVESISNNINITGNIVTQGEVANIKVGNNTFSLPKAWFKN